MVIIWRSLFPLLRAEKRTEQIADNEGFGRMTPPTELKITCCKNNTHKYAEGDKSA